MSRRRSTWIGRGWFQTSGPARASGDTLGRGGVSGPEPSLLTLQCGLPPPLPSTTCVLRPAPAGEDIVRDMYRQPECDKAAVRDDREHDGPEGGVEVQRGVHEQHLHGGEEGGGQVRNVRRTCMGVGGGGWTREGPACRAWVEGYSLGDGRCGGVLRGLAASRPPSHCLTYRHDEARQVQHTLQCRR